MAAAKYLLIPRSINASELVWKAPEGSRPGCRKVGAMRILPSMTSRIFISLSLLALVTLGTLSPGSAQAPRKILVGASSDDVVRPLLYGVDAGLFKKAGLDVEIVKLNNGAAVAAAVAGGSVQLGKGSSLTPVLAYAKGIPFTVTANLSNYTSDAPTIGLLALNSSPIHTAKDLVGKTIGVTSLNDISALGLFAWLEKNGVDQSSVKFLELTSSAGQAALEANRVDAMMFLDPILSAAVATNKFRVVSYPTDALGHRLSVGTLFGLTAWVNAHRDEVTRFNRALSTAEAYVAAHEEETKPLEAKFAGLELSQMANVRAPSRTTGITTSDLQIVIDAAAKYKLIAKDFNANDFICECAIRQK
jgi:NitT/TauT family transport system substrate-binding protein